MHRPRIAAMLLFPLALQNACVCRGALRQDFYRSETPQTDKIPFPVAVYQGDKMAPQMLKLVNLQHNLVMELQLNPGFKNAIKTELARAFYTVVDLENLEQFRDQKYLAVGLLNAAYIGVFIFDFQARELVAGYQEPLGVGELPVGSGTRTRELLEKGITEALPRISQRILADKKLREYPLRTAAATLAEWEGDRALKAKSAKEAYAYYYAALTNTYFSTRLDERVREKYLKAASVLKSALPGIPDDALQHHHTAINLIKEGQGEDERIKEGIAELEKAVEIAPWWERPYYNLAIAYESLEDAPAAVRNYRFYLWADPEAADAQAVLDQISKLKAQKA